MPVTLELIDKTRRKVGAAIRAHAHEVKTGNERGSNGRGVVIPQVIKTLLSCLNDEDLSAVVRVYREAMVAERRFWIDEGKDENGRAKGRWEIEADHKTRISAANMVAAYMEGLPVQRQIQVRGEFVELGDMLKAMSGSGEARRLLPGVESLPSASEG